MKKAGTSGISSSKKDHDWSDLALKDEDEIVPLYKKTPTTFDGFIPMVRFFNICKKFICMYKNGKEVNFIYLYLFQNYQIGSDNYLKAQICEAYEQYPAHLALVFVRKPKNKKPIYYKVTPFRAAVNCIEEALADIREKNEKFL